MSDDNNLQLLEYVKTEALCRELIYRTETCGLKWTQRSSSTLVAISSDDIEHWTFLLSKTSSNYGNSGTICTLDILLHGKQFASFNSELFNIILELNDIVYEMIKREVDKLDYLSRFINDTINPCGLIVSGDVLAKSQSLLSNNLNFIQKAYLSLISNSNIIANGFVGFDFPEFIYMKVKNKTTGKIVSQKQLYKRHNDLYYPFQYVTSPDYITYPSSVPIFLDMEYDFESDKWKYWRTDQEGGINATSNSLIPTINAIFDFGNIMSLGNEIDVNNQIQGELLSGELTELTQGTESVFHIFTNNDPYPRLGFTESTMVRYNFDDFDDWRVCINGVGIYNIAGLINAYSIVDGNIVYSNNETLIIGGYVKVTMKAAWIITGTPPTDTANFLLSLDGASQYLTIPIIQNSDPISVETIFYGEVTAIFSINTSLGSLMISAIDNTGTFMPGSLPTLGFTVIGLDILELI